MHTLNLVQDRIQGVQTGQGIIPATTVLICAGAWSAQLIRFYSGSPYPPLKVRRCGCRWKIRCFLTSHVRTFYLIRTSDTEIILGSTTEPEAGFDDQVIEEKQKMLFSNAVQFLPRFGSSQNHKSMGRIRPPRPAQTYIGPVPGVEGLFIAAGHGKSASAWHPKPESGLRDDNGRKMEEDITKYS